MPGPQLEGDALSAVTHRGSHLQIIASAGSGKTEVVSQRVADLLATGTPARAIVAFTFTERAAGELSSRIAHRVEDLLGSETLDLLGGLFVGTIHSYCFRLLQQHVPRFETYDVLDDNQLTAFLCREANRLNLRQLDPQGRDRVYASIEAFLKNVDVVENELLDPEAMPDPFRTVLTDYLATLERYRLLTYGQQIVRAVHELERGEVAAEVHEELRHLIVDEYQDINPAQERLIELLTGPDVQLCVVGDDDQAIYQWRGSDIGNIVEFSNRYEGVATFSITTNRRSRPQIIDRANRFATSIAGRLEKTMLAHRPGHAATEIVVWYAQSELDEAGWIAQLILDLADDGVAFRDIAVLVRTSAAYPKLVDQFATFDIPVQPGGRIGLFEQREATVLGRAVAWLTGLDWKSGFGQSEPIAEGQLLDEFQAVFQLDGSGRARVADFLHEWRSMITRNDRRADLVGELYELLAELDVRDWDLGDQRQVNRLGTLARFSSLLADYESVRRRARPDAEVLGEQVGGEDRGTWYYKNLGLHIINYANGAYEGFDGEPDFDLNAVDLTTIHRAKGLEWPVVFVPSLTAKRFPSTKSGRRQQWLVPRDCFAAARYEGGDPDERRLFYVAITRARDWLSLSRHERVNVNSADASPYWSEHADLAVDPVLIQLPQVEAVHDTDDDPIAVTYSEMAMFLDCGHAYRLRNLLGFEPRLAPELGYGKAVHHVLRTVADATRSSGQVPTSAEIDDILDGGFFLPTANKPAHRQLKDAARRLINEYASNHADDLFRIWETERPFELHLDDVTIAGRADVILDREDGVETALAILDYKTSTSALSEHQLQLQVYTDAGRREGLDVRAAYVHDLRAGVRAAVPVDPDAIAAAEQTVAAAAVRLRGRDYNANPGPRCRRCEVRTVCPSAQI
ncbi:MAG: ATP-dependent DNA helicase [Acidimicrobiales bacterium]